MTHTGHAEQGKLSSLRVDDNASDSDLLVLALRRTDLCGRELCGLHSLSAALQTMEIRVPDAVLLELTLPDLQGMDRASRSVSHGPSARSKALLADTAHVQQAAAGGA